MKQKQLEKEHYSAARRLLETKVSEQPEDERFHSALGLTYAGLGLKEKAILEGKRGVELMRLSKDALRGIYRIEDLARIYTLVGEHDAAIAQLEHLLSIPADICGPYRRIDPVFKRLQRLAQSCTAILTLDKSAI